MYSSLLQVHILQAEALIPSFKKLSSPKLGNAPAKRIFSLAFLLNSLEIDHTENSKEWFEISSKFSANPSFLELATGANELKRVTERADQKVLYNARVLDH